MKDTFNESLPYITHFVALHPILTRLQILLTVIRHLTLIKGNLSSNNSVLLVHTANCNVCLHCMLTIICHCNNFEHFSCVVTVTNCLP